MKLRRGELYLVFKPGGDVKQYRIFAIVSRQALKMALEFA